MLLLYAVCCHCSQRILPLPNDNMFARSPSANQLPKSPQLPAKQQMPFSSPSIASAFSANAVVAAFDPLSSTQYV